MKTKRNLLRYIILILCSIIPSNAVFAEMVPQHGGVLKMIYTNGPQVIGYIPEMGPGDSAAVFPAIESIMEMNEQREIVPFLAKAVDIDSKENTMTIHLHHGIKFHDGSTLTAEVAAWNYQLMIDSRKLQFSDMIQSIKVVDDYTLVIHFTSYNNQLEFAWGWVQMFSKAAFEKHGKEWARKHVVGTGPFKQVKWTRDVEFKWTKFEDYWQDGRPYLDGIDIKYIPDPVTASSLMLAKQADLWNGASAKEQKDLERKGLVRKSYWEGLPAVIYLNNKNKKGPLANLKVRKAVEYALNKDTIAKTLGYGYYTPLKMMGPEGSWAYDSDYTGHPYNPQKARQLLSEAGYNKKVKLTLLALNSGDTSQVEAIKAYLGDVGIMVDLDLADPGRFYSSLWGTGWNDMMLFFTGIGHNSLAVLQSWFGHQPKTQIVSLEQTPRLLELSKKSITYPDIARQKDVSRQMAIEIAEQVLFVPLYNVPAAYIVQPWVHTNYLETGLIHWKMFDMWMEKH